MTPFSPFLRTLSLLGLLWLAACGSPSAPDMLISRSPLTTNELFATSDLFPHHVRVATSSGSPASFDTAMDVSESDLSDMRGGFALPSGFNVAFGLSTSTAVDGVIVNNFNISAKSLNGVTPQNLQQMVQVGANNSVNVTTPSALSNNVITVIQNTTNNVTIKNTNQLNINVSNLAAFRNQAAFQNSIGPMVRSMH